MPLDGPPLPNADTILEDLTGTRFTFYEDERGERQWRVEEGEVKRLTVLDTLISSDGQSASLRVALTLQAAARTISGDLSLLYRPVGGRWSLAGAVRVGDNFAVGESEVWLYDTALAPADFKANGRSLRLTPIAHVVDGLYRDPYRSVRDQERRLLDSTFAADTLREAAFQELEVPLANEAFAASEALYLLRATAPPEPLTDSLRREVSLYGCRFLHGITAPMEAERARSVRLVTSSSVLRLAGRTVTDGERQALDRVARRRLQEQPDAPSRFGDTAARAADVDGDGDTDLVGVYGHPDIPPRAETPPVALAVAIESADDPAVLFTHAAPREEGSTQLALVALLDVDGDGAAELILRESGYETYGYRVLSHRAGRFADVYSGGGGGC